MKLIITLAVTALLALSMVQALNFLEKEEILKKIAQLKQEEMEEGDNNSGRDVIDTPSSGIESSIVQELGLNQRVRKQSCGAAGLFGGGGGDPFNELLDNCNAIVTKIVVHSKRYVDSIQATYTFSNGQIVTGGRHGGTGGDRHEVVLNADEKIISIFGASERFIDRIGFVTDQGQVFGPYGGTGGTRFNVNDCVLSGIFGHSEELIYNIGFYC